MNIIQRLMDSLRCKKFKEEEELICSGCKIVYKKWWIMENTPISLPALCPYCKHVLKPLSEEANKC